MKMAENGYDEIWQDHSADLTARTLFACYRRDARIPTAEKNP